MNVLAFNPIVAHQWGESAAADLIWAEVCGRAPSKKPWQRKFMALQAYLDESYTEGGIYVLAGYLASAENWAAFSQEWERLLPLTTFNKSGKHRFKMAEMAKRMDSVPLFYDVIRKYVSFGMSIMINAKDLQRAKARLWSDNTEIVWSPAESLPVLTFRIFFQIFFQNCWDDHRLKALLTPAEPIDLYFDNNTSSEWMLDAWDMLYPVLPYHITDLMGQRPRFVDDEQFLPLQAADFWAWWVRRGYETGKLDEICNGNFGFWQKPKVPGFSSYGTEDQLVETLISILKNQAAIPALVNIYDAKERPPGDQAVKIHEIESRSALLNFVKKRLKLLKRRF